MLEKYWWVLWEFERKQTKWVSEHEQKFWADGIMGKLIMLTGQENNPKYVLHNLYLIKVNVLWTCFLSKKNI